MGDIEQKALALLNAVRAERGDLYPLNALNREASLQESLCRAIEQHEAFRQEVSATVFAYIHATGENGVDEWEALKSLIIAKPDPLADCLLDMTLSKNSAWATHDARHLRLALEARGLEIKEKTND